MARKYCSRMSKIKLLTKARYGSTIPKFNARLETQMASDRSSFAAA